ncbi:MAG: S8 family peptidase [Synechococcales bacterium]|nr:S8 family peptidase [Synechococcales bacterium]
MNFDIGSQGLNQPLNQSFNLSPTQARSPVGAWYEDRVSISHGAYRGSGGSMLMDQLESIDRMPAPTSDLLIDLSANRHLTMPNPTRFDSTYGYGAVDAAAAVARAIGESRFWDVPDLGGLNQPNDQIFAPEVWNRGFTGQGVIVAVLDTGVDYTHFDLAANIWINSDDIFGNGIDDDNNGYIDDIVGWDFEDNDYSPLDTDKHGTHVAGTIASINNGVGTTGVAYNAQIMPVRVLGNRGGSNTNVAQGIRYAADNGAHVINMSLGGSYSQEIEDAIEYASLRGSFVVMAAGNDSLPESGHPARYATDRGIAVGAVDAWGQIADFSNRAGYDSNLRYVVAPGVEIFSTIPGHLYDQLDGTSMAAPHVAGVVALMLSANPGLTQDEIRSILIDTAIGHSNTWNITYPDSLELSFATPGLEQELPSLGGFYEFSPEFSSEFSVESWVNDGMPSKVATTWTVDQAVTGQWSNPIVGSDFLMSTPQPVKPSSLKITWAEGLEEAELLMAA